MSDREDNFDPNDVLKGWSQQVRGRSAAEPFDLSGVLDAVARHREPVDPTRLLDGWVPGVERPEPAPRRWRGGDVIDVVPLVEAVPAREQPARILERLPPGPIGRAAAQAAPAELLDRIDDAALTDTPVVVPRHTSTRLVRQWQPGVWTGAVRRVCDATTEFVQTPQGPVIESNPPHLLLALWPAQGLHAPLLGRWPLRALLSTGEGDRAPEELLPLIPPGALLWLTTAEVDWALVGDLVLHHDTGLRPYQLKALRAFVEAERQATYDRVNDGYEVPLPGQPLQPRR